MQRHFGHIEGLDDIGEVLQYAVDVCKEQGVVRLSYHFTPLFDAPTSPKTTIIAEGFSRDWLRLYYRSDFRAKDPIPARTMLRGAMLTWADAQWSAPNSPENDEYFAAMRKHGLIHGFGLPLFGPRGRNAFASMDFDIPVQDVDPTAVGVVRMVTQAAHQRACILLDMAEDIPELTDREIEVLGWVANGKSVSVIADILGISPDTVKTYTKRIYAKLDTSDRVGAVVKALKLGLVNL